MYFEAKIEDDLSTYILENGNKVAHIRTFKGIPSITIAENIKDILNIRSPRHKINVGGSPQYATSEYGFEIRINDSGIIGKESTSVTVSTMPDYHDCLKGRFTPDFFSALCDAMPTPDKPKRNRGRTPAMP